MYVINDNGARTYSLGAYFIICDLKISAADFEELFQPFAY